MVWRRAWARIRGHLPLAGAVALALATRLFRLTWPGIWGDEGFTIFLARSSLPDLFVGTANDLHPPFFYLLLKAWLLPGWSEVYVRLLPVLCGVLTVVLAFWIGRRLFDPVVGAWAAFYLALSPLHVLFSREVRMYVVLILLGTLSAYLAWRWMEQPLQWGRLAYVAVTLAALYTQNMALFVLVFENLFVLWLAVRDKRWKDWGHWILGQVLLLLGYLPWIPVVIDQALHRHPTWIGRGTLSGLAWAVTHLVLGQRGWQEEGVWQVVALAWLGVLAVVVGGVCLLRRRPWRRPGSFVWAWFLVPGVVLFGLSLRFPIFQEKQFLLLTVPLALLMAIGTAGLRKGWRVVAAVAFLGLVVPSLYNIYFRQQLVDHPGEEAWRDLAAYIDTYAEPGDALFYNPGAAEVILGLYLKTPLPREAYPQPYTPRVGSYAGETATPERVAARLEPFAGQYRRIWLAECCLPEFWDPQRLIRAWLEQWGRPVEIPSFPGLQVRLYESRR